MKYLIIPDIHTKIAKFEEIILKEGADFIITTCDTFDEFQDYPGQYDAIADWLKKSVNEKNRIHLFSNHVISYINPVFACSGFTESKYNIVKKHCNWNNTYSKLKWHYNLDNEYIITHAGFDVRLVPLHILNSKYTIQDIDNYLTQQSEHANLCLQTGRDHWFFQAGFGRGGLAPVGGLVWCDWEREFEGIPRIKQICGHTRLCMEDTFHPYIKILDNTINFNLDTYGGLNRYATYQTKTKKLEIKSYFDL